MAKKVEKKNDIHEDTLFFSSKEKPKIQAIAGPHVTLKTHAGLGRALAVSPVMASLSLQGATSYPSLAAVWPSWAPTCW